jgi:NAD(P)-dependent dehydrogenase (short-subunit alcohol dehydrogenase family)
MTAHLYILTGASRGMGLAMATQLLRPGHSLVCISRHASAELARLAREADVPLAQWTLDLTDGEAASERLRHWLGSQSPTQWQQATLINNAAAMPRIAPLAQAHAHELANTLRAGLEAPMQLTAAFLSATSAWGGERRVLNISSGLGRRAMAAQAPYCAIKAGMDHFTRCLALEEASRPNGARVCSLAPGVIDTDMQVQLRGADAGAFPDQPRFAQLKERGLLSSPQEAAASVLAYLARADFGSQAVADVRET